MLPPETRPNFPSGLPIEFLEELRKHVPLLIRDGSPLWWSTDYEPDPREYLQFNEFKNRLTHVGLCDVLSGSPTRWTQGKRDVYLYDGDHVPITILDLEVYGLPLKFFVTVRPYTENELHFSENENLPQYFQVPTLNQIFEQKKHETAPHLELSEHFFPIYEDYLLAVEGTHFFGIH